MQPTTDMFVKKHKSHNKDRIPENKKTILWKRIIFCPEDTKTIFQLKPDDVVDWNVQYICSTHTHI